MSFLTPAELETLTGRTQAAAQIRQLRKRRIRHQVNANGKPVVTWAAVEGRENIPEPAPIHWEAVE